MAARRRCRAGLDAAPPLPAPPPRPVDRAVARPAGVADDDDEDDADAEEAAGVSALTLAGSARGGLRRRLPSLALMASTHVCFLPLFPLGLVMPTRAASALSSASDLSVSVTAGSTAGAPVVTAVVSSAAVYTP